MPNNAFKLLITRPEEQGRQLAKTLANEGYQCVCQPFFDYQANASSQDIATILDSYYLPIVVFVSVASVEFFAKCYPITQWQVSTIIAVGQATKKAIQALGINNVVSPTQQDSDGVLALTELENVKDKNIIIVRGDGGRELIADTLVARGANVQYIESYQRHWFELSSTEVEKWQDENINCVIITSNALLESVVELLNSDTKIALNYWKNTCLWIVASERLVEKAHCLGLKNVICAYGASDTALLAAIPDRE